MGKNRKREKMLNSLCNVLEKTVEILEDSENREEYKIPTIKVYNNTLEISNISQGCVFSGNRTNYSKQLYLTLDSSESISVKIEKGLYTNYQTIINRNDLLFDQIYDYFKEIIELRKTGNIGMSIDVLETFYANY